VIRAAESAPAPREEAAGRATGGAEAKPAADPEPPPSAIRPRARRPAPSPKRAAARQASSRRRAAGAGSNGGSGDAPVDQYDDLEADEIVTLLDSLEDADLAALLEYEQANRRRPRVVSAIEGTRARRGAGQRG
jgi:hypothetical protein